MAISVRYFLINADEPLKHIPQRVSEGLHLGIDEIPEFAGSKQRVIEVVLENENGKPVRILDARGRYWFFDDKGRLDRSDMFSFMRWMDVFPEKPKGNVVDLRPGIERKKWKDRHFWEVTGIDLDLVAHAVWPFASDGLAPALKSVKGSAHKVPPLTRAGEEALGKIQSKIHSMTMALEGLSEPSLKGLAYALRRSARLYQSDSFFYEAAAAHADRQREIRSRHRTGKGNWYAQLQVWKWNEDHSQGREINTIEELHKSKPEAIAAARRLIADNAHLYDMDITIDAKVLSELEWVPMEQPGNEEEGL